MGSRNAPPTLRELLGQLYVPVLLGSGFSGPRRLRGKKRYFRFDRAAGQEIHRLTIIFDHKGRPRFAVDLAVIPADGLGPVIRQGGSVVHGRLLCPRGPFAGIWFRADRPWWKKWLGREVRGLERRAVDDCLRLWPEVEAWWGRQRNTRHIRVRRVVYRGVPAA